jgi:signal transduction histidine kinase
MHQPDWTEQDDREMELAQQLNASLHELSQPLTALLCLLELGSCSSTVSELERGMSAALEECNRLRKTVHEMQSYVQQALQRQRAAAEKYRARSVFVV